MTHLFKIIIIFAIVFANTGCIDSFSKHGYFPNEDQISKVRISKTHKETLTPLLGSPSFTTREKSQEHWYYVSSKKNSVAFLKPKIIENNILKISMDNNVVTALKQYNLSNMNNIVFVDDTTDTQKIELGILKQLLGNAGRFSKSNDFE
jgi:outer membrane protein assembly factor BamE (lipoprotein component of BamABCDE complex)